PTTSRTSVTPWSVVTRFFWSLGFPRSLWASRAGATASTVSCPGAGDTGRGRPPFPPPSDTTTFLGADTGRGRVEPKTHGPGPFVFSGETEWFSWLRWSHTSQFVQQNIPDLGGTRW